MKHPSIAIRFIMLLFAVSWTYADAVTHPDPALDADFAAQIKSIDEFIARFNGIERHPEIENDSLWRTNNLTALFDYRISHPGQSDKRFESIVDDFINTIQNNDVKLSLADSSIWAEAESTVKVDGKNNAITLILRQETLRDNLVRWAIVGVRGLAKNGIIKTDVFHTISPVEHEIHFMSLDGLFRHNRQLVMGYRGKNIPIDELSVFLAWLMTGKIEFDHVDNVTIHCLDIPGYVFTINEQARGGNNSGWLISSLIPLPENEKNLYIQKLLKNEKK